MILFEETNPSDIPMEVVYTTIKSILPTIKQSNIHFLYHGTYNVFEVVTSHDDTGVYIFRFPDRFFRGTNGLEMINKEIAVLKLLHGKFSVSIPQPFFYSDNPNNPFVGYEKIPGVSLSKLLTQLTEHEYKIIAKRVAVFLKRLHSPKLGSQFRSQSLAKIIKYQPPKTIQLELAKLYTEVQNIVYPKVTTDQQNWLKRVFEDFLNNKSNFEFTPRLTHGDFDSSNILIDPVTKKVTGIIDFEEVSFYDPAVDLLFFREGKAFLTTLLDVYGADKEKLLPRMHFYFSKACVHYLLFGIEHNRPSMISAGREMLNYRQHKSNFPHF